jgi:hypothetical protein
MARHAGCVIVENAAKSGGRDSSTADGSNAPQTAIVNEPLAKAAFAGQDPSGQSIIAGMDPFEPMTIVGVVGDARRRGPARMDPAVVLRAK